MPILRKCLAVRCYKSNVLENFQCLLQSLSQFSKRKKKANANLPSPPLVVAAGSISLSSSHFFLSKCQSYSYKKFQLFSRYFFYFHTINLRPPRTHDRLVLRSIQTPQTRYVPHNPVGQSAIGIFISRYNSL